MTQPNFILICADDMRADLTAEMPLLTGMAGAVEFTNGMNVNPVCCPSRTSFLSGNFCHTTGIYGNNAPVGGEPLCRPLEPTFWAPAMQREGYTTAIFGKYLNGYTDDSHVGLGWDRWYAITHGSGNEYYGVSYSVDGVLTTDPADQYLNDTLRSKSVNWINNVGLLNQPYAIYIAPVSPHSNFIPRSVPPSTGGPDDSGTSFPITHPASFNEADVSDKPDWYAGQNLLTTDEISGTTGVDTIQLAMKRCVQSLDRLIDTVAAVDPDAVFIFWSDNGYMLGEHRLSGKSVPYLEAQRMPLVVRWSGLSSPSTDALVQNIDIAPTMFDIIDGSFSCDGKSMLPVWTGSGGRTYVFNEDHAKGAAPQPAWAAAIQRQRTYTWHSTGEEEWYNTSADPLQQNNRLVTGPAPSEEDLDNARGWVASQLDHGMPPGMTEAPDP